MADSVHTGGPLTGCCQAMKIDAGGDTPAALRAVTLYTRTPAVDSVVAHELVVLVQFVH